MGVQSGNNSDQYSLGILVVLLYTLYYYCSVSTMSKRLNSSGNTTYDAKMKSSFGKSTSRISDYTAYQNGKEKLLKAKIQLKKVPSIQKKEIKEKPELFLNELDKDVQDIDQKG